MRIYRHQLAGIILICLQKSSKLVLIIINIKIMQDRPRRKAGVTSRGALAIQLHIFKKRKAGVKSRGRVLKS